MSISMSVKLTLSLLFLAASANASILDYLDNMGEKMIQVPELRDDQPNRNCLCKGPACVCCVEFNITFVDLGGPGCVHMKYLSPEEGFSVNVSYGKSLIHSSKIKGTNPDPICLRVFGKFAQVCAKFNDLAPTADGLRGCLELEPRLFGDPQLEFPIGCFKSTNNGGMEMEEPEEEAEEESTNVEENETGLDTETLVATLVQTAEQGVALLSSLLDLQMPNSTRPKTTTSKPTTTSLKPEVLYTSEASQSRSSKSVQHPNKL